MPLMGSNSAQSRRKCGLSLMSHLRRCTRVRLRDIRAAFVPSVESCIVGLATEASTMRGEFEGDETDPVEELGEALVVLASTSPFGGERQC